MKTEIEIEIDNQDYSIYVGNRQVASQNYHHDEDWLDRCEKAIALVKLAGGKVIDNRTNKSLVADLTNFIYDADLYFVTEFNELENQSSEYGKKLSKLTNTARQLLFRLGDLNR